MSARLIRASGAGNTFYIADLLLDSQKDLQKISIEKRKSIVKEICASLGPATDGLFFIEEPSLPETDFKWDFYNADGSNAEMCGNAARCAAIYFYRKTNRTSIDFSTRAGVIHAEIIEQNIAKVKMSRLNGPIEKNISLGDGPTVQGFVVDSGVPHFVTRKSLTKEIARQIRMHNEFLPSGTNVTEIQSESDQTIQARSYERGVEDFTQACGTGAVAAASVIWKEKKRNPVHVNMPGGLLKVYFSETSPHPLLEGPVDIEAEYDLSDEFIGRYL